MNLSRQVVTPYSGVITRHTNQTLVQTNLLHTYMQRCDPAPFYLFDEIDAALDPQVR